jgi:PAS domain S-box-containing protein
MGGVFLIVLVMFKRLWSRCVNPLVAIESPDKQRQARFLAALTFIVIMVCYTGILIAIPVYAGYDSENMPWLPAAFALTSGFWVPYLLYRFGRVHTASVIYVLWVNLQIVFMAWVWGMPRGLEHLYFGVLAAAFAAFVLPLRVAGLLLLVNGLIMAVAAPPLLGVEPSAVYTGPLTFNVVNSVILLIFAYYWQRKEAATRVLIKQNADLYRIISEAASDYTVYGDVDAQGNVYTRWTLGAHEAITGYTTDEVKGTDARHLFHPDDVSRMLADQQQAVRGQANSGEYRMIHKNGTVYWASLMRRPLWDDAQKRVIGFYAILRDITARKRGEEQQWQLTLQQKQMNVLNGFVQAISHDFRSRLTIIGNNGYLIGRSLDSASRDKVQPRLDAIHTAMEDITLQIDNLVELTQIASPIFEQVNVSELLQQAAAFRERLALARQIAIQTDIQMGLPPIQADPEQILTALDHLVTNAINYGKEGGRVDLRAYQTDNEVVLTVTDDGAGIPPEQIATIFAPFAKVGSARTISTGGVGLGLTITKMIADAHHGKIDVQSVVGEGSTFRLALPVAAASAPA